MHQGQQYTNLNYVASIEFTHWHCTDAGHMWGDLEVLRLCHWSHLTWKAPDVLEGRAAPFMNWCMHWASSMSSPEQIETNTSMWSLRTSYQVSNQQIQTSIMNSVPKEEKWSCHRMGVPTDDDCLFTLNFEEDQLVTIQEGYDLEFMIYRFHNMGTASKL